jgi:phospholipase/carboxylesterase
VTAEPGVSVVALHGVARHPAEIDKAIAHIEQRMASAEVRWLFPRAPERPLTILGGRAALAWYDVLAYDRSRMDDLGIEEASEAVAQAVREERALRPTRRIVLVGFSQGGALALHAGLRLRDEVEAIIGLAAALPFPDRVPPAGPRSPRVILGHGRFDRIVPYALGRETFELLKARGYATEWHPYWCGHVLAPQAIRDVGKWLRSACARGRPPVNESEGPEPGGLAAA